MAKGQPPDSWVVRLAMILERLTFGCAIASIATNESYREVAITRGGMLPSKSSSSDPAPRRASTRWLRIHW